MKPDPVASLIASIEIEADGSVVHCGGNWVLASATGLEKQVDSLGWPVVKAMKFAVRR